MRVLLCSDQHITNRKPKNRTDSYFQTVLNKLNQEVDIAIEENCSIILFPGDIFDSSKENHFVVQEVMYVLQKFTHRNGRIFAVPGQHDQIYHSDNLAGTPLQTLQASGVITVLTMIPTIIGDVAFYGAGWKQDIPEITSPKCTNILITHRMILNDEKLWSEQTGADWSNHLMLKTKFDLICSGDNHQQFTNTKGNRHIVNLGSMMRSNITQLNHHPAVVVYDTDSKEIEIIDLDIKPFNEVMQIEKATKEKERNLNLESFVRSLKKPEDDRGRTKLNIIDRFNDYMEKNEIPKDVQDSVRGCLK